MSGFPDVPAGTPGSVGMPGRGRHRSPIAHFRSSRSPRHAGVAVVPSISIPAAANCFAVVASGAPVQSGACGAAGSGRPLGRTNRAAPLGSTVTWNPSSCTAR